MSVAYIDPGNYGTDISGAEFGYGMLWVGWLAGITAMLLQYSQVALSLMLPLPLLPLWMFTRDKNLMGELVNRKSTTVLAGIFVALILVLNAALIYLSFV
jgi:Mn2+/Fe2+ NRAMP family transporter